MKKKSSPLDLKSLIALGIDVSKQDLHIAMLNEDHLIVYERIANQRADIDALAHRLVKSGYTGKIILESTARYHYLLAWRLSEAGLDVRVINPLLSSKHIIGQIRKTKTVRSDAEVLRIIGLENHLSGDIAPAGSSRNLSKQLKCLFSGSKVRKIQR